jgi:hypothetical protein
MPERGFPGSFHSVSHTICQNLPIFMRTIVPFSGADIASGPVEMNVECSGFFFSSGSSDSGKVRVGFPGPIITLWMRKAKYGAL